jgi:hypothetical protein
MMKSQHTYKKVSEMLKHALHNCQDDTMKKCAYYICEDEFIIDAAGMARMITAHFVVDIVDAVVDAKDPRVIKYYSSLNN